MHKFLFRSAVATITLSLPLSGQTTKKAMTHTHHTHHVAPAEPVTPEPGTAAVGEMPAVTGKPQVLYALKYVDIVVGTGELAEPRKFYTVEYTGWTLDGKKFDSSYDHHENGPFVFPVGARRVITAWDTGFDGMRVGGKRRLIVPYQLAYGVFGHPPAIPEKAMLIFDVELLGQSDSPMPVTPAAPAKPAEPAQPAAAPAATTTPQK